MNRFSAGCLGFGLGVLAVCLFVVADAHRRGESARAVTPDALKLKCAEMGRHVAERDEDHSQRGMTSFALKYGYNAELNTCIYEGSAISGDSVSGFVQDMMTGENLASYVQVIGKGKLVDQDVAKDRFDKIEQRLFGPAESDLLKPSQKSAFR